MLVSTRMITGFNTDVSHEGHVYHVQTEDRGEENPVFESLIYVGGTIVAKKRTSYSEQLSEGASDETLATLLKRQHQVIIAAIRAGRIEDLIRHTKKEQGGADPRRTSGSLARPKSDHSVGSSKLPGARKAPAPVFPIAVASSEPPRPPVRTSGPLKPVTSSKPARKDTGGLNLDQVIADYLKRSTDEESLDITVLTPDVFIAGSNVGLRVQVAQKTKLEFDAIVTVKIIGTAFKPQVFIGRVGRDGVANFSLSLPSFSAGTAAIVIEAQSGAGRGELKKLIRRA